MAMFIIITIICNEFCSHEPYHSFTSQAKPPSLSTTTSGNVWDFSYLKYKFLVQFLQQLIVHKIVLNTPYKV